jgi:anti-sigma regulatory factor (Ser/Thr protein kinase)
VTLLYLELEIATGRARLVVAGHPPPVVVSPGGRATYVDAEPGLPLGLALGSAASYVETAFTLDPGSTLFLYTDGLVDRPDLLALDGFDRLRGALDAAAGEDLERLCDEVLSAMSASTSGDDIAIVCLRRTDVPADLHLEIPADPSVLAEVRAAIRTWLAGRADDDTIEDMVLASSEAVTNAVEHAYRGREPGSVEIDGTIRGGELVLTVRDHGRWARSQPSDRGRGTSVIQALVDDVEVERRDDGTEVRLRRSLRSDRRADDDLAPGPGAGDVTPSSVST